MSEKVHGKGCPDPLAVRVRSKGLYSDSEFVNEEELSFDVEFISEDNKMQGTVTRRTRGREKDLPPRKIMLTSRRRNRRLTNSVKRN